MKNTGNISVMDDQAFASKFKRDAVATATKKFGLAKQDAESLAQQFIETFKRLYVKSTLERAS